MEMLNQLGAAVKVAERNGPMSCAAATKPDGRAGLGSVP